MNQIDIRELTASAPDIVSQVEAEGTEFVITHNGRAVARLIPMLAEAEPLTDELAKLFTDMDALAAEIGAKSQQDASLNDILNDMREQSWS